MLCGFSTVKTDTALRDAFFTEDSPQPCLGMFSFDLALFLVSLSAACFEDSSVVDSTSTDWFGWVEVTTGREPFPLASLNSFRRS